MALTAYQTQFKRRMKRAINLRARADAKARRYGQLLADAIGAAEGAAAQMNALNQRYNVDVSTYTLLTQALHATNVKGALVDELAKSTPGEELVLFNQVPDGNGGALLPLEAVFGEVAGPVVSGGGTADAPSAPRAYGTTLTGPNESGSGVTLAAAAGDTLGFDSLSTGGSAPASMDVTVGGVQVASVAYLDRYTGRPFGFTTGGVAHTGAFAAAVNF